MLIIVCVLSFLCLTFLFRLFWLSKNFKKVIAVLDDVRSGNTNRRFYPEIYRGYFKLLCAQLNTLMDKFEETNLAKQSLEVSQKRMISDISHDLRTPLASLMGYTDALRNDSSLVECEKRQYLDIISQKSEFMYKLVQDFFEMARLESDDMQMEFQQVDLVEKVREIMISFYQDFKQNKLTPDMQIGEESIFVQSDISGLDRILNNLISNAIHYGKDGGVVGVALREETSRVWVDIWDCGKGIPEKDIKLIFERLYTSEKSRNEKLRGSGLGLSIIKKLLEHMKGDITVSSVPGGKTIFSFYIPKNI